jgi:hypothetical protein
MFFMHGTPLCRGHRLMKMPIGGPIDHGDLVRRQPQVLHEVVFGMLTDGDDVMGPNPGAPVPEAGLQRSRPEPVTPARLTRVVNLVNRIVQGQETGTGAEEGQAKVERAVL